jgi:hypothetical protein
MLEFLCRKSGRHSDIAPPASLQLMLPAMFRILPTNRSGPGVCSAASDSPAGVALAFSDLETVRVGFGHSVAAILPVDGC